MKAIMMSIRPEWVAKILNKEKTIEVRKHFPSDYVGWVYIYATKKYDECLWYKKDSKCYVLNYGKPTNDYLNGKVVARFWCDKVSPTYEYYEEEICDLACITKQEYLDYLGYDDGYAIHITKLEIFDKPKEISKFKPYNIKKHHVFNNFKLTRAPQSWCYVEVDQ